MNALILLSLFSASEPPAGLPINYEPRPANPWVQSVALTCGQAVYRISGYGVAYPAATPVRITVNGRPVRGEGMPALARDLAERGAAYRIVGLCSRRSSDIQLQFYRGLAAPRRPVSFHVGTAEISARGRLIYEGLEEVDAETFWFR